MQVISPQLIILRVATGAAWNRTTQAELTTISFSERMTGTEGSRTLQHSSQNMSMSKTSFRETKMDDKSEMDV